MSKWEAVESSMIKKLLEECTCSPPEELNSNSRQVHKDVRLRKAKQTCLYVIDTRLACYPSKAMRLRRGEALLIIENTMPIYLSFSIHCTF